MLVKRKILKPLLFLVSTCLAMAIRVSASEAATPPVVAVSPVQDQIAIELGTGIKGNLVKQHSINGYSCYKLDADLKKWLGRGDFPCHDNVDVKEAFLSKIADRFLSQVVRKKGQYIYIAGTKEELNADGNAFQDFLSHLGYTRTVLNGDVYKYCEREGKKGGKRNVNRIFCKKGERDLTFIDLGFSKAAPRHFDQLNPDVQNRIFEAVKSRATAKCSKHLKRHNKFPREGHIEWLGFRRADEQCIKLGRNAARRLEVKFGDDFMFWNRFPMARIMGARRLCKKNRSSTYSRRKYRTRDAEASPMGSF